MTHRIEFDDQLRAWADLGDERLPVQYLHASLAQIDTTPQRRPRPGWLRFPTMNRFAPYALAATALVVITLIGISLFVRPPDVGPTPPPGPSQDGTPDSTPGADAPLGGGLILAYQQHEPRGACENSSSEGPFDLFTLDAGTGEQTLLGTTVGDCSARHLSLQWAPDRQHVLMTDEFGQETKTLDTPTAAGRALTFICCDLPTDVWQGGASQFDGWLLSPAGDLVSAIHTSVLQVPGEEGSTGISDGIVVANADGSGRATLSLPEGAAIRGWASWSPDQSALVVSACRPCNHAPLGQPATAENHEHIYVVPLDGSPVRELLDDTTGWFWTPLWSPDGSSLVMARRECLADWVPFECDGEYTSSLVLVDPDGGTQRVLVTNAQLGESFPDVGLPMWSRDSGRIAFSAFSAIDAESQPHVFVIEADGSNLADLGEGDLIQWSPDGEWLLFDGPSGELWIMRADGSDARSLGTFHHWQNAAAW
jgi:WD40 repeat protein